MGSPSEELLVGNVDYKMKDSTSGEFWRRHLGPSDEDQSAMLKLLGVSSLEDLIGKTVPESIREKQPLRLKDFDQPLSEQEALELIREISDKNVVAKSFIGMGYSNTYTPTVIARNILENPGWYTQYTPYQPEIAQGRLEALLNYQTAISDLTGFEVANASLLDEATAAAEAMTLSYGIAAKKKKDKATTFFVSDECHPQTIDVIRTRAEALGFIVEVGPWQDFTPGENHFGALVQYPGTYGDIHDYSSFAEKCHEQGALLTVAADVLALTVLRSPASFGADIAVGNTQRFGVPLGYGGPHAAYFATKEAYKRTLPGRLVGVSKDSNGGPALRLALQTREQHIRREKATSNICTAQVLLAIIAGMYAVYHGREGLVAIAGRIHRLARGLKDGLSKLGLEVLTEQFFDTITVKVEKDHGKEILFRAHAEKINLRMIAEDHIGISLDETTTEQDVDQLLKLFSDKAGAVQLPEGQDDSYGDLKRTDAILTHSVFEQYQSETEMLRYIRRLESKDLSLCTAMIPLGSCTMKLNATSEMVPISFPGFSGLHPFAPLRQAEGYKQLFEQLEGALAEMTGFDAVSLQPNAGSQGEYAGLLAIRAFHRAAGDEQRDICLIPHSAHGTNPASAIMAGMKVVAIDCDADGNIDIEDLKAKAEEHKEDLAALMVTYPSTHGVFEEEIKQICEVVHQAGGQVYMDGANLNALIGIAKPGSFGADVCHMNLHKTFCIPHGGGGPGVGPIGVKAHLAPHLPSHIHLEQDKDATTGAVSASPWGSASILPIPWMYVAMMGAAGLTKASEVAILNANYIAKRLSGAYEVLYTGKNGYVAHECILDLRPFKQSAGIEVVDIAKRLIDYGFHAPTVSWPVPGTMMIEPTESESLAELDRFCDALLSIREEIALIENEKWDKQDNPLKHAPHTARSVSADEWPHAYSREVAAYPSDAVRDAKFWPAVGRLDESYGDRNLVCSCPTVEELSAEQ